MTGGGGGLVFCWFVVREGQQRGRGTREMQFGFPKPWTLGALSTATPRKSKTCPAAPEESEKRQTRLNQMHTGSVQFAPLIAKAQFLRERKGEGSENFD